MFHTNLLVNFGIDIVATLIMTRALYFSRHKRRDLFVIFTFFNVAMFIIVSLISHVELGVSASFGLFALLAIVRLRSEEFSNYEMGYFFGCLTLAIVNGLGEHHLVRSLALDFTLIATIGILDHPSLLQRVQHCKVSLDSVYDDDRRLVADLERILNGKVLTFSVTKIDNVRDITNVSVEYQKNPLAAAKRPKRTTAQAAANAK